MIVLCLKIGASVVLESLSLMVVGAGIYIIANADGWTDRLFGAFVILSGIFAGFSIAGLWIVRSGGIE